MDWAASFSILTRPGVMTYILTGVLFTVVIAAAAVLVSIVLGSILALVRNYCTGKTRIFADRHRLHRAVPQHAAAFVDLCLPDHLPGARFPGAADAGADQRRGADFVPRVRGAGAVHPPRSSPRSSAAA